MTGVWDEYLDTPNTELIAWFGGLRPRYRSGIVSNSFVGARERESERYGFDTLAGVVFRENAQAIAELEALLTGS